MKITFDISTVTPSEYTSLNSPWLLQQLAAILINNWRV